MTRNDTANPRQLSPPPPPSSTSSLHSHHSSISSVKHASNIFKSRLDTASSVSPAPITSPLTRPHATYPMSSVHFQFSVKPSPPPTPTGASLLPSPLNNSCQKLESDPCFQRPSVMQATAPRPSCYTRRGRYQKARRQMHLLISSRSRRSTKDSNQLAAAVSC
jgi:hypothetical protein